MGFSKSLIAGLVRKPRLGRVNNLTSSPPFERARILPGPGLLLTQSTFGGFLFQRSALPRRISSGLTSGLPGPRSCDEEIIHQKRAPYIPALKNGKNEALRRILR